MTWDRSRFTTARWLELGASLCGLLAALALNHKLGRLASAQGELAHPSPDLLLSVLPRVDLRFVFVYGFAAFLVWLIAAALWRERHHLAHIAWLYALLIAVRSLFIVLTPMRTPADALWVAGDPLFDVLGKHLTFKHDLFFSSHTALPFLAYLIFRDRWARWSFLAISLLMAFTVLATRLHYSIDVLAAFFITYALYRWERRWLRAPYRRLRQAVLLRLQSSWPMTSSWSAGDRRG